jgi:hypothetical protein
VVRLFPAAPTAGALALSFAFALVSPVALADGVSPGDATAAQKKQAMEHFTAGKTAAGSKSFEKAIEELRASLDVVNSPNARLELARALRDVGQTGDAWAEYGRVGDDARRLSGSEGKYAQAADAASAERAEVEHKLAFVTVTIAHPPLVATLRVGGRPVPPAQWSAPVITPEGAVDVVLVDDGGKELARQTVLAVVGQKTAVALDAEPAPPPPPPAAPAVENPDDKPDFSHAPEATTAPPSDRSHLRPYAYVAGGVGIAGLAVFTTFGLISHSDFNDLRSACPNVSCPSSKAGEISDGRSFQTIANVGLVVGLVGAASGATIFVLSLGGKSPDSAPSASTGTSASLFVAPGYFGVRGSL